MAQSNDFQYAGQDEELEYCDLNNWDTFKECDNAEPVSYDDIVTATRQFIQKWFNNILTDDDVTEDDVTEDVYEALSAKDVLKLLASSLIGTASIPLFKKETAPAALSGPTNWLNTSFYWDLEGNMLPTNEAAVDTSMYKQC